MACRDGSWGSEMQMREAGTDRAGGAMSGEVMVPKVPDAIVAGTCGRIQWQELITRVHSLELFSVCLFVSYTVVRTSHKTSLI